jgi:hypothetical protein
MLTAVTLEKTLSLLDEGYTSASITEETGLKLEVVEAPGFLLSAASRRRQLTRRQTKQGELAVRASTILLYRGYQGTSPSRETRSLSTPQSA